MRRTTLSAHRKAIDRSRLRIERRLEDPEPLRALARAAGMAEHHFHRRFRELTGETPGQLARRLRLERAALSTWCSDAPIHRLAGEAGFRSHEAFTRAFRRAFGTTPQAFRRRRPPVQEDELAVRIVSQEEMRVVAWRHTGPYDELPVALCALFDWATSHGVRWQRVMTRFLDSQRITDRALTRVDLILHPRNEVDPEALDVDAPLRTETVPAGRYAVASIPGEYDVQAVRLAYERLFAVELPERGETPAATWYETHSGPAEAGGRPTNTRIHVRLES